MPNPYTTMRQNLEYALEHHAGLAALGFTLRKWDSKLEQWIDKPAADHVNWMIVHTLGIETDPFWSNGRIRSTHRLQIAAALGTAAGKRLQDIEEFYYQLEECLIPLCRDLAQSLHVAVPEVERITVTGGETGLTESEQPRRQHALGNIVWSHVAAVEITYERDAE